MQNPDRDLWPDDINQPPNIQTPVTIMKEQAALLGQKTSNLVVGDVRTYADNNGFHQVFNLEAPSLGGYKYELLRVIHSIKLYPVDIHFDDRTIRAESQEEFVEKLREIFAHDKTKNVIQALIAQSQK